MIDAMGIQDFLVIWLGLLAMMLACRCVPLFVLRGRALSPGVADALGLIPPAAFAALVANDLLAPGMFAEGLWPQGLPLVAAAVVVFVALRTRSLVWSAVAGVVAYAVLGALPL